MIMGVALSIIFGLLVLVCFAIGKYLNRHKGDYYTKVRKWIKHTQGYILCKMLWWKEGRPAVRIRRKVHEELGKKP